MNKGTQADWYLTKITVPCGAEITVALADNIEEGNFEWGKVERVRKLEPNEISEIHHAEIEVMKAWAKTLPGSESGV